METLLGGNVDSGVVDPNVDAAEGVGDVFKTGLYRLVVTYVEGEEFGLSAVLFDFVGNSLALFDIVAENGHVGAVFGEYLCHVASESAGGTCDTDSLSGKVEICHNTLTPL